MPLTFSPGLTPVKPMEMIEVQNVLESKTAMIYPPGLNSDMPMDSVEIQDAQKSIPCDYSCITTLMIRGIPSSFTEQDVFRFVVFAGLEDKCDFVYVPRLSNSGNQGCAFLNFAATIHAWTCAFFFNDLQLDPFHSRETCMVAPAKTQGVANLKKHFGHSSSLWFRHPSLGSWVTQKMVARICETAAQAA